MADVPNTSTFTFQDVTTSVYGDNAAGRNLSGAFTSAISGAFNASYSGSKNSQLNFRNYSPAAADGIFTTLITTQAIVRSLDRFTSAASMVSPAKYSRLKVAISNSGQYQTVIYDGSGYPIVSNDYGVTWSDKGINAYCSEVIMDGTGQYQYVFSSGYPYTTYYYSTDYGQNWSTQTGPTQNSFVACSNNTQYRLTKDINYLKYSSDYGASYTTVSGNILPSFAAMSYTGQYAITSDVYGAVKYSSNYGASWTNASFPDQGYGTTGYRFTNGLAVSGTGQYMYAGPYYYYDANTDTDLYNVVAGMKSSNYGASWSVISPAYTITTKHVKMNYNGSYILVGSQSSTCIYSNNYGASFSSRSNSTSAPTTSIGINQIIN